MNSDGQLIVAVDFDSTIADILTPALAVGNTIFGTNHRVTDIDSWDWFEENVSWTFKDFMSVLGIIHRSGNFRHVPGAIEAVKLLMAHPDIEVYCLTNNKDSSIPHISKWLEANGIPLPVESSNQTRGKHTFDWDILVDDKPDIHCPAGREVITFGQPYNDSDVDWATAIERILATRELVMSR